MLNLADLLGLHGPDRKKFIFEIENLEKKVPSGRSVSAKILGKIYLDSAEIVRILGFSDMDVLKNEAVSALKNKFLGEKVLAKEDDFWKKYSRSAVVTKDGIVSANKEDIEKSLSDDRDCLSGFRKLLQEEICERFAKEIPNLTFDKVNKILFKEKK